MQKLELFNSLSGKKQTFKPIDNLVKMYVCGPTVYDFIHIGNARSLVVYDLLYRLVCYLYGFDNVLYVRNITDVDDKIKNRAKELCISINELTEKTIAQFHNDVKYLNCLNPTKEPRATQHIGEMIEIIQNLLDKGYAYVIEKTAYFDVTKYKDYTKLSGRTLEELMAGTRLEEDIKKKNSYDFVLWKPLDETDDATTSDAFDSPWGKGYPGWHIECSAMSYKYLGNDFDIHGGGIDLIFPHHTNEIAQSCCAFSGSEYAKYWVHNGFLKVDGKKMSKSEGNFITVADLRNRNIPGSYLRYALLLTNYRKPLNFTENILKEAEENLKYIYRSIEGVNFEQKNSSTFILPQTFLDCMLDDLNTHGAFAEMLKTAKKINKTNNTQEKEKLQKELQACVSLLGLQPENIGITAISEEEILNLIGQREKAKEQKDWGLADSIRDKLSEYGVALEDKPNCKTSWRMKP